MDERRKSKTVYFDEERFWYRRTANVITVGLTQAGLDELGTVESITLPDEGDEVDKGDETVEFEGNEGELSLCSPATGIVIEVNTVLERSRTSLNEDPDGEGWIFRLECANEGDLKEFE